MKEQPAVDEWHRQLWPGQPVPVVTPEKGGGEYATRYVTTSVMVAYVLHMCSSSRPAETRKLAYGCLRSLFDKACQTGCFRIQHVHFSLDLQHGQWTTQELRRPTDFQPWTQPFFDKLVAFQWSLDLVDDKKIGVTSVPPRIHPADFVLWTMDITRDLRRQAPETFSAKTKMQSAALSLLTQLASFIDGHMRAVTMEYQFVSESGARPRAAAKKKAANDLMRCFRRRKPAKRTSAAVVWEICGRVSELLFSQEERWISKAIAAAGGGVSSVTKVLFDGSDNAMKPVEIFFWYSNNTLAGAYAPPVVRGPVTGKEARLTLAARAVRIAWEIDAKCRQILNDHNMWTRSWLSEPHGAPCVFGDVLEQLPRGSIREVGTFFEKLDDVNRAHLQKVQYCFQHGQCCSAVRTVDVDVSGLPCQDNSRANIKRKLQDGRFVPVYMVWAKKHRHLRTPLLIIENTPDMPMDMIGHLLSTDYHLHQLFVDPADVGHAGVSRARTYVFCAHKQTCSYIMDVHEMHYFISQDIRDFVQTKPRDYMVAPEHLRTLFQQQICRTRKMDFVPGHSDDYWLLNERERFLVHQLDLDYVHMYQKHPAKVEDLIYFLGDRYEHTRNRQRSHHATSDAAAKSHNQSAPQGNRQGCSGAAWPQASVASSPAPCAAPAMTAPPAASMAVALPTAAITWPGGFVSGTDPVSTRGMAKAKGPGGSHDKDELIRNLRDEWNRLGRPMSTQVVGPEEAVRLVIQYFTEMANGGRPRHPGVPTNAILGPGGPPALPAPPAPGTGTPAIAWEPAASAAATASDAVPVIATVYTVSADEAGQWSLTSMNTMTGEDIASCTLPATATGYYVVVFSEGVAYFWDGSSESEMVHCEEHMAAQTEDVAVAASAPGVALASALLPGMSGAAGPGLTSTALVPRLPADDDEDDFSSAEEIDQPVLVAYSDGSQSLFYRQRAIELPTTTRWKLVQDPSTAEWLVDAENQDPNVKPKWVAKLMSSKRSRQRLDYQWELSGKVVSV
ncbi:unnamed protein product [Symbiodinium sp. CCMP2456]|nr:unnamed protein product [Symbiodinium sp. CCMP2456]